MILFLPLVLAATDTNQVDDIFRIHQTIDYKKACFNNGTHCSAAATCNYTVFKPNNVVLVQNQTATNQGAFHNVSFNLPDIGIYQIDMTCCDGALCGAETFYAEVTGSGFNDTVWFYVIVILLSFGVMVLGFILLDPPIVILGTFGLYFLGIYILLNGIVGIKDLVTTWAIGIIVLGLAGYISIKSAWEIINDSGQ